VQQQQWQQLARSTCWQFNSAHLTGQQQQLTAAAATACITMTHHFRHCMSMHHNDSPFPPLMITNLSIIIHVNNNHSTSAAAYIGNSRSSSSGSMETAYLPNTFEQVPEKWTKSSVRHQRSLERQLNLESTLENSNQFISAFLCFH
jgi:hypothetical protein